MEVSLYCILVFKMSTETFTNIFTIHYYTLNGQQKYCKNGGLKLILNVGGRLTGIYTPQA